MWRGVVVGMHLGHILFYHPWNGTPTMRSNCLQSRTSLTCIYYSQQSIVSIRTGWDLSRVGTMGGGTEGKGPCACPGGGCDYDGIQGVHGWANQQDGDKHEAPASAPHRPLSLRTCRLCALMAHPSIVPTHMPIVRADGASTDSRPPHTAPCPYASEGLRRIEGEERCRRAGTSVDTFASLLWSEL